jgi:hypothetical protein
VIDITSHGLARDPDFLYAALDTTACAAFIKESRMNFLNAIRPHRNPGDPDFPVRCAGHDHVCGFH